MPLQPGMGVARGGSEDPDLHLRRSRYNLAAETKAKSKGTCEGCSGELPLMPVWLTASGCSGNCLDIRLRRSGRGRDRSTFAHRTTLAIRVVATGAASRYLDRRPERVHCRQAQCRPRGKHGRAHRAQSPPERLRSHFRVRDADSHQNPASTHQQRQQARRDGGIRSCSANHGYRATPAGIAAACAHFALCRTRRRSGNTEPQQHRRHQHANPIVAVSSEHAL